MEAIIAEIARIRSQVERKDEALTRIADDQHDAGCKFNFCPRNECPTCPSAADIARTALEDDRGSLKAEMVRNLQEGRP